MPQNAVISTCLRILFGFGSCAVVGLPLAGYAGLQSLLLDQGVYEERCQVAFSEHSSVVCADRRFAFAMMYVWGSMAYAAAFVTSLWTLRYVGYIFAGVCGALLLAAGALVLGDPDLRQPVGPFGCDPTMSGYALLCFGAPFLITASLDAVSMLGRRALAAGLILAMIMQLSPMAWPLGDRWLAPQSLMGLLGKFLWVPLGILLGSAALMPFPASEEPTVVHKAVMETLNQCFVDHSDYEDAYPSEMLPLMSETAQRLSHLLPRSSPVLHYRWLAPMPLSQVLLSRAFVLLMLNYSVHSLSLDLIQVSGQVRAMLLTGTNVDFQLTLWSPVSALIAVPIVLWISRRVRLSVLFSLASIAGVILTAAQTLEPTSMLMIWVVGNGSVRILLFWSTVCCVAKCFGFKNFTKCMSVLMLASSVLEWGLLPYADYYLTFESSMLGPPLWLLGAQVVISLWTLRLLWEVSCKTRRRLLEREAWMAFSGSAS